MAAALVTSSGAVPAFEAVGVAAATGQRCNGQHQNNAKPGHPQDQQQPVDMIDDKQNDANDIQVMDLDDPEDIVTSDVNDLRAESAVSRSLDTPGPDVARTLDTPDPDVARTLDTPNFDEQRTQSAVSRISSSSLHSRPTSVKLESRVHSRAHSRTKASSAVSRRTITRSGRKSRAQTAAALSGSSSVRGRDRAAAHDSDTDHVRSGFTRATTVADFIDLGGVDIYNDAGWDTDLEQEKSEEREVFDATGKAIYLECCKHHGVIPASYFLRHMSDSSLEMKHHGLGPHGIKPIAISLVSNTQVLKLNLTDNWLGPQGGLHVCEMLKENCYITELDLSDNRLNARFAERWVEVLGTNSTLIHATLAGNDFDDNSAVFLADAILNTTKLEYLNLSKNKLGELAGIALGPAIAENTSLKHLDLSWNSIRRRGAVAVAQGIKNNVLLQKINLSWNGFGNDGAKALGEALKVNASLQDLDISNNRMTPEGAVLLGKGMVVNETLKVLMMGKNPMQSAGCYAICAATLKNSNPVLTRLDFSDIMINKDFLECFAKLKEMLPELQMRHGGDGVPKRPKARVHPMIKLKNYIEKHNLRLVDFFNVFDKDNSMSVTREEFTDGIVETGIKLTDDEVTQLLDELDKDGDGEINYSELVMGHQDFTEKEKKMASSIMSMSISGR